MKKHTVLEYEQEDFDTLRDSMKEEQLKEEARQ